MKNKKRYLIKITQEYRIPGLIVLSLALMTGGINLLIIAPAGAFIAHAGGGLALVLGAGGCVASYLVRRKPHRPLSGSRKMLLGGGAFLVALFGMAMTVLSAGGLKWSASAVQTACFASITAAGIAAVILILDTQKELTLEGFAFLTGERFEQRWGLTGLSHVYEGERRGVPLRVSIGVGSPDAHGKPRYVVSAVCLVDNPLGVSLRAHPDRFREFFPFPYLPKIPRVPRWERHTVRGRPADAAAAILPPFRRHEHTIFSEAYGFERLSVHGHKVRGRFVIDTGDKHRITDIIEGFVFFSGHFN